MSQLTSMNLIYKHNNFMTIHPLNLGENIIGSHLITFTSLLGMEIPQYGLKIIIDSELNLEIEVMNTHYKGKSMQFGKFKPDGKFKEIKPGRIYMAEEGEIFGYEDTEIRLNFEQSQEKKRTKKIL